MRHLIAPLFVPATRPDRFEKAARSGADAVIIDLEDAVPPAHNEEARSHVAAGRELAVPVVVRINPEGTPWYEQDMQALADAGIGFVCLPKAEDLPALDRLISMLGPGIGVMALIETARGVENAAVIAGHPVCVWAGVWTENAKRAIRVARRMKAGQVCVNAYGAGGGIELPFGGIRKSGHGREKGMAALLELTRLKAIVVKHH